MIACQKPAPIQPAIPNPPLTTQTLTVTGSYYPQSCHQFLDLRLTPTGELVHDDTAEPENCDEPTTPFQLTTFRFPVPDAPDLHGFRIALHQYLLSHPYHFTTTGFQLTTDTHTEADSLLPSHLYAFAAPGKQILQAFFDEPTWQQLRANTEKLEFTFQLIREVSTPCPTLQAPCPTPTFTLLQGHYNPTTDLVNLQDLPDLTSPPHNITISPPSPELQFQLLASFHTLRIRSIYHLLTEDFALRSEETDCRHLQNQDLQLIPATGYYQLEVKLDPPYLDCLRSRVGDLHFQLALLH